MLTPVYNGAEHFVECIESVLGQTYSNWEYTIVNNCSTDESLAIAQEYAAKDSRIHIVNTNRFLGIIENHNFTAGQISPASKYAKFVFADDWLYPNCVEEMVRVAEHNPSVGIVGAYTMDGRAVRWHGPAYPSDCVDGRDVCRDQLRGGPYVFGTMTSLLLRSDLIRKRQNFFGAKHLQADMEACFDILQESDFGFIHQVLSFSRERPGATDSFASNLNSHRLGEFVIFLKYGRALLGKSEYQHYWKRARHRYHLVLAHNVLRFRPREFWKYHEDILAEYGGRIDQGLLWTSVLADVKEHLIHPVAALKAGLSWWHPNRRIGKPTPARPEAQTESPKAFNDTEPLKPA